MTPEQIREKVILYQDPNTNMVIIMYPSGELPLIETANKDVPTDVEYWIVNKDDLPDDRTFRDAWIIDKNILGKSFGRGD